VQRGDAVQVGQVELLVFDIGGGSVPLCLGDRAGRNVHPDDPRKTLRERAGEDPVTAADIDQREVRGIAVDQCRKV
jgi:exopolyphosphatase/pppGpp-phosphohydrolase